MLPLIVHIQKETHKVMRRWSLEQMRHASPGQAAFWSHNTSNTSSWFRPFGGIWWKG